MHALGNLTPLRLAESAQTQPSRLVKSWRIANGQVDFIIDSVNGLQARILNKETTAEVSKHWIKGVPEQIQSDLEKLSLFLQDTYITISILKNSQLVEGNQFKITVKQRGRGGMLEPDTTSSFSELAEDLKVPVKILYKTLSKRS